MPPQTLVKRVERLEARVTVLEQLPARVDELASQISHLRNEMRDEFSAVRGEMRQMGEDLRGEMRHMGEELRNEMRALHEDGIDRLTLLFEGRDPRKPPIPRPKRKP